jgi:LacI family repressor for deo operon, udp, cdd, tsx, nupC, and nupG
LPQGAFERPFYLDFSAFSGAIVWQMIEGIIKEAKKRNYDIKIEPLFEPDNPEIIMPRLTFPYSDGVILCGIWELENLEKKVKSKGIPYVVMASEPSRLPELPEIAADFGSGVRDAMHYLTEQKHKNIAIFTPSLEANIPGSRLAEARDYLLSKGCFRDDLVYIAENESKFCSIIDKVAETRPFTAAFCHNDTMALMLIKELRKKNINCPDDVAVIGFDDNPVYHDSGLSTVSVPRKELGAECVKTLINIIEREDEFNGRRLLPTRFIKRQTC